MDEPSQVQVTSPTRDSDTAPRSDNQFALLRQRRFAPFFWTQFGGAMNDNVFKFALTIMVTYQLNLSWLSPAQAGLVIGAVFIFPFVVLSATSGQLTDRLEKTRIIRFVKNLEIAIMLLAAVGFWRADDLGVALLLICILLMGVHSTLFGPVKYALLPQVLSEQELTGGNGLVEMGTFVAILLGNLLGGALVVLPEVGHAAVACICLAIALMGRLTAQFVPPAPASDPNFSVQRNPLVQTWQNLKLAREDLVVYRSLLGISWMWFVGAVFLSQFPSFAKDVLHGGPHVASLLLIVFSLGVGIGALLCETLSGKHVEIGLVPLGALGMSVFTIDLYFATQGLAANTREMGIAEFVRSYAHWRVMADMGLLACCAGLYSVPMYALIQLRSPVTHRARIIAANNILNALFMIASSLLAGQMLAAGATIPQVFLAVAVLNLLVAGYVFVLVPEYLLRFVTWLVSRLLYRLKIVGYERIPRSGAAILTSNHESFIDAALIMAASFRPVRFVLEPHIAQTPLMGWFFRLARAIPLSSTADSESTPCDAALDAAQQALREGDLLCISSRSTLHHSGSTQTPHTGCSAAMLEHTRQKNQHVAVIPMALTTPKKPLPGNATNQPTTACRSHKRTLFGSVGLTVGEALHSAQNLNS